MMTGLVLTAGGARGAYQAGVLKRIAELPRFGSVLESPFKIITGASAGAINGAALAAGNSTFRETAHRLVSTWENVDFKDVFCTDLGSMGGIVGKWVRDLSFGGMVGGGRAQSLLDARPLRKFLEKQIPFDRIAGEIDRGTLYAVAISATSYYSGKSYTFIEGQSGHPLWLKSRRVALSSKLSVDHVWASSAIPVVFQPIKIDTDHGSFYFGDGALRLTTPCSPSIRLGAKKVFAIGIRSQAAAEESSKALLMEEDKKNMKKPPLAQVFGIALNSIFLDHLDSDLDHLMRMNDILRNVPRGGDTGTSTKEPMSIIEPLVVYPSADLGKIAGEFTEKMPKMLRYMLDGLGSFRAESADLSSYLMFYKDYSRAIIDLGYKDASAKIDEIDHFLAS